MNLIDGEREGGGVDERRRVQPRAEEGAGERAEAETCACRTARDGGGLLQDDHIPAGCEEGVSGGYASDATAYHHSLRLLANHVLR